jgi:protein involved in polysaccharide export with SLBB domain
MSNCSDPFWITRATGTLRGAPHRPRMSALHFTPALFIAFILLIAQPIGCSKAPQTLPLQIPVSTKIKQVDRSTLGIGDVVEIRVYQEKELSGLYRVSPQGTFTFPLIGDVQALDHSPSDLAKVIVERLKSGYLRRPHVTVFLKESNSKKIFILGKVKKPGTYTYEEGMSVVQAIALAGGLLPLAAPDLILIRESEDEPKRELRFHIPFKQISRGRAQNAHLQPGDILFIPESWL